MTDAFGFFKAQLTRPFSVIYTQSACQLVMHISGTFCVFRQEKMSLGQKPPGDITQLLKFITQIM